MLKSPFMTDNFPVIISRSMLIMENEVEVKLEDFLKRLFAKMEIEIVLLIIMRYSPLFVGSGFQRYLKVWFRIVFGVRMKLIS